MYLVWIYANKPFEDIHERDHFLTNMLTTFKSLYAHKIENIQDRDHKNIRHVHQQGQRHHKVILTFHVQ